MLQVLENVEIWIIQNTCLVYRNLLPQILELLLEFSGKQPLCAMTVYYKFIICFYDAMIHDTYFKLSSESQFRNLHQLATNGIWNSQMHQIICDSEEK